MNKPLTSRDIEALTVEERLQLIEDVWASLERSAEELPVPDWHKPVIDERLRTLEGGQSVGSPWDEVRRRIVGKT
ncbi:MAG: addiction module protein [Hyphomicrobium aestuarii]|nr:addiction module protein [Hyphomicrobium aestuarii]